MQFLRIDTHLAITSDVLHAISVQLEQGSTRGNYPYDWELTTDDDIERLEDQISDLQEDCEDWEYIHRNMKRKCEKLKDKLDDLQSSYDDLEKKYRTLLESHAE